jgi:hypothetical protein
VVQKTAFDTSDDVLKPSSSEFQTTTVYDAQILFNDKVFEYMQQRSHCCVLQVTAMPLL